MLQDLGRCHFLTDLAELGSSIEHAENSLDNLSRYMQDEYFDPPLLLAPMSQKIKWEPLGVVLVFGSWNYPYVVNLKPLIQAIATGNCCIVKPSEFSPISSAAIKKLVEKYLDPRCFRVILGDAQVAISLNKLKFDLICFTGST